MTKAGRRPGTPSAPKTHPEWMPMNPYTLRIKILANLSHLEVIETQIENVMHHTFEEAKRQTGHNISWWFKQPCPHKYDSEGNRTVRPRSECPICWDEFCKGSGG